MSKPAPTLIDELYRLTFSKKLINGWRSNNDMRHALESARRFVVDEPMAVFMAELANESFIKAGGNYRLCYRIADSLRVQSRLPHESIWIEYPLRAYVRRSQAMRGRTLNTKELNESPIREGWLLQQHPKIDTAIMLHMFNNSDIPDHLGYDCWTFPLTFAWTCDDSPLPWHKAFTMEVDEIREGAGAPHARSGISSVLLGLPGYSRDNIACVLSPLILPPVREHEKVYQDLLLEWQGIIRRIWALLATIDNLPITRGEVRQSKGFLARGRIRKFLDHQTITLNVPAKKDTRVLARQVIALAHRKRHEVRAHWRDDWRNPPSRRCNPHLWECYDDSSDILRCELCGGRQIYIHKHERGDASLGYVTHDYLVKHEAEEKTHG